MQEILKRLEIIKNAIEIEDEELIEFQIQKLKKLELDEKISSFINRLQNYDYSVIYEIKQYLQNAHSLIKYEDIEINALKLELKQLEKLFQTLYEEKIQYLNKLEDFNRLYHIKLGEIVEKIVQLQKKIAYYKNKEKIEKFKQSQQKQEEINQTINEIDETIEELDEILQNLDENDENYEEIYQTYEELKQTKENLKKEKEKQEKIEEEIKEDEDFKEYEEAEKIYEEFYEEYEEIKESIKNETKLTDEEKSLLKTLYKKAVKLCHPDLVSEELKEKATKLMQELNDANANKDIQKVKEILHYLETGEAFQLTSDTADDKKILKKKIQELKEKIKSLKEELEDIKQNDSFGLTEIYDLDEFIESFKDELIEKYERLSEELEKLKNSERIKKTKETIKDDYRYMEF
ncbi:hypothetical protein [Nautilia sp.]